MRDYQPIDLSSFCNAGASFVGKTATPAVGRQSFYGLPFQIGTASGGKKCFLGFNGRTRKKVVPVGKAARWVIFAHAMVATADTGEAPAIPTIAHYIFHLKDGQTFRVPIRERMEIAQVPTHWGLAPLLAVPDAKDARPPRFLGFWQNIGWRQTEVQKGWAKNYYLWAWQNPTPDQTIESIEIEAEGQRFIIAGITLSQVEEPPLFREGKRAVKITLPKAADAERPFDLEVEVDRGVATYPNTLPKKPAKAFLEDDFAGWGEAQNRASSPAYVEIAANPSATITVRNQKATLGRTNWGELQKKKKIETSRLRIEVIDRGKNWVHTTVLDDATGQPMPCRIHFRTPEGIPYAPHGHHAHVNSNLGTWHIDVGGDVRLGQASYAYIDGRCQGWLPRGEVIVDAARGFEYEPLRTKVTIKPGQRELVLRMKRACDMSAQRWFSGDTHVHFLSTQGAHCEALGEDVRVVNLLQSQWGSLFTNTEEFTGRPSISQDGRTIVYCSQENRQHMLGHMSLLGLQQPVMPWCSDGPDEAELGGIMQTVLAHWADECHAQGGTVILPHFPMPNCEPASLIATGRVDAVEMGGHNMSQHAEYYRYLNCGYRMPLVGGTDKMTADVPMGLFRTYVYIPEDEGFSHEAWCRNLRAGRTFMSSGPLISLSVEGQPVGSTLQLSGHGGTVEVEAAAESIFPIHCLQIVQHGQVVAQTESKTGTRRLHLTSKLKVNGHTWIAARCSGPGYIQPRLHHDDWHRGVMAHTSPAYIACGGAWEPFSMEDASYMLTMVEGGLAYVRERSAQLPEGWITHHHGAGNHSQYLERPFLEAMEKLRERMMRVSGFGFRVSENRHRR